jgi:F-type H+-transporting ATPase subunit b
MNQRLFRRQTIELLRRGALIAATCAALAAPAFAQEGDATTTGVGPVFRWINFAIVALLVMWGFSKAVAPLRKRAADISNKIAEGARAREAAEKQRQEVQAKLATIDDEVAQLRADAKRAADAEALRLRGLAKEEAQSIERAGLAEILAAERAARIELKALAGQLAVRQAEAVLRQQINPAAEAGLFRAFIEELQESRN